MNKKFKIGICQNLKMWNHEGNWTEDYIRYCIGNNLNYEIIDPYANDAITKMKDCSAVLWNIQNYLFADLLEARNLLLPIEKLGIKVFPNHDTNWHFDDKIAEMYAFKAVNAPIPESWVFYSLDDTKKFLDSVKFPIVAKLRNGSGASNVKLLKTKYQALTYAKRMFGRGVDPSPSLMYKAFSKAQSSRDWKTLINRIKKIPIFLYTRSKAKMMPIEKGYCYFQSFIENDGYDLKVFVIGDKMSFVGRRTRKYDFRASGGGKIFSDKKYMTKQIIDSSFKVADSLNLQCVGFDYVIDKASNNGLIIEMSYGTGVDKDIFDTGGYYTRDGKWINEPLNIPEEIIKNLI